MSLLFIFFICIVFLTIVSVTKSRPRQRGRPYWPGKPTIAYQKDHVVNIHGKKEYILGDMALNRWQYKQMFGKEPVRKQTAKRSAATSDPESYWPDGRVPVIKDFTGFDEDDVLEFERVIKSIENVTCLTFPNKTPDDINWAKIEDCDTWDAGCWSNIGRGSPGSGEQNVCLGHGCHYSGTYAHELGHLVGLLHEQERSDRDDNIIIHWENIADDGLNQFSKVKEGSDVGTQYDFSSTMHYEQTHFSKDGTSKTMSAVNTADNIKFVDTTYKMFNFYDTMVLNVIYKCAAKCDSEYCEDGYIDKHCNCVTEEVFAKSQCYDVKPTSDCEIWIDDCEDQEWKPWMASYCKKTCKKCYE